MSITKEDQSGFQIPELETEFVFTDRPTDIPGDLRPVWRIALVLLLLKNCCRESKARFSQLHVLNWGVRSEENRRALELALVGQLDRDALIVRIEPSLNRAVDLAIGEKLIRRLSGDQVELTATGRSFVDAIEEVDALFRSERDFMSRIKKKVTGTFVDTLFR